MSMTTAVASMSTSSSPDDVHAVGVGPTEPALANLSDFAALAFEGVLVIEKAPLRFEILRAGLSLHWAALNLTRNLGQFC
jgi:hypothetical protein